MKKHYCIDCGKETYPFKNVKRCRKCADKLHGLKYKGKNHPNWKGGKPKCVDCGKLLSGYRCKRCKSCARTGKLNPWFGKKYPKNTAKERSKRPVQHHIYKQENSKKTIELSYSKNMKLHHTAYDYLYEKYGEKGIDDYIKWFDKKFG